MTVSDVRVIAVVPARGGSKGIRKKNIKELLGKPLLAWSNEVARESGVFHRLILSTEEEEIAGIGRASGAQVPYRRPHELAGNRIRTNSMFSGLSSGFDTMRVDVRG